MTFLTTRLHLKRKLAARDLQHFPQLSTVYGIRMLSADDQTLVVEYDASRIHEAEVLAAVRAAGISADPEQPIPPGGFDSTGEFKDFPWPITGLSPANQKAK